MANLYHNDRLIIAFASLNQSDKQLERGRGNQLEARWPAALAQHQRLIGPIQDQHGCGEVCHQSRQGLDRCESVIFEARGKRHEA